MNLSPIKPVPVNDQEVSEIANSILVDHDKLGLVLAVGRANGNFRQAIFDLQRLLESVEGSFTGDTDNCPLKHSFANGICVREIFIPATTLYVSRIHRFDHHRILLSGELTTVTETDGVQRMKGPVHMLCPAGTKRAGYAHTDCRIMTIHQADGGDALTLTPKFFCDTYAELEGQPPKELS